MPFPASSVLSGGTEGRGRAVYLYRFGTVAENNRPTHLLFRAGGITSMSVWGKVYKKGTRNKGIGRPENESERLFFDLSRDRYR